MGTLRELAAPVAFGQRAAFLLEAASALGTHIRARRSCFADRPKRARRKIDSCIPSFSISSVLA
jgi:hypothetical protein